MKMIIRCLIVTLCFVTVCSSFGDSTLTYKTTDDLQIAFGEQMLLSASLTISPSQYVNSGSIEVKQSFAQKPQGQLIYFNTLVFNLTDERGQACYLSYFNNQESSLKTSFQCTNISTDSNSQQYMYNHGCLNMTKCSNETIQYQFSLDTLSNNQAMIFLQNNHNSNTEEQFLSIHTETVVNIVSSNAWFFWAVGLTCLLVINLIMITGVVLYWALKYKKTKRRFEEFKITEGNREPLQDKELKQQ